MQQDSSNGSFRLERLIFFSDALFAISITLLVLELEVPRLPAGAQPADFADALLRLVPSAAAFVLSFVVVGAFWIAHHRLFGTVRNYDDRMIWPNLLFLMSIAMMPFATAFLGSNGNAFIPALVYNLNLLITSILLWWVARRAIAFGGGHSLEREDRRTAVTVAAAALCVALAFIVPQLSQLGMLLAFFGGYAARSPTSSSATEVAAEDE